MGDDRDGVAIFAAILGIVVAASLLPVPAAPDGEPREDVAPPGTDTLLHFLGYAAVAYTLAGALAERRTSEAKPTPTENPTAAEEPSDRAELSAVALLGVAVAAATLGGGLEVAQGVVPGRDPSAIDAVANAVGAVAGAVWWRHRNGRS